MSSGRRSLTSSWPIPRRRAGASVTRRRGSHGNGVIPWEGRRSRLRVSHDREAGPGNGVCGKWGPTPLFSLRLDLETGTVMGLSQGVQGLPGSSPPPARGASRGRLHHRPSHGKWGRTCFREAGTKIGPTPFLQTGSKRAVKCRNALGAATSRYPRSSSRRDATWMTASAT